MTQQTNLQVPVDHTNGSVGPNPVPEGASPALAPQSAAGRGRSGWIMGSVLTLAAGAGIAFALRVGGSSPPGPAEPPLSTSQGVAIPVKTVFPIRKTLVRSVELPGSLRPWAQAELYAKVSGYLKSVQHEVEPGPQAALVASILGGTGAGPAVVPGASLVRGLAALHLAELNAEEKDIGSPVAAGETLLVIDAPELLQDLEQKQAVWLQRKAEVEQAATTIATAEAAVRAAAAKERQAEADVHRAISEHTFVLKQYKRLQELARDRTITQELVDEKQYHVNATKANWESSLAKVQASQAERAVVSSKLATARADLSVKQAQVHVAREDHHKAQVLAEYARIQAPFDGVITYRGVDEGDFVQNSSSGQTRLLMTVSAIDRLRVVLDIPEQQAVWVRPGSEAVIRFDTQDSWVTKGKVSRIAYSLDNQARTMRVEIDVNNRDRRLMPGMYGQVRLTLQRIKNALAIPATALYNQGREVYVIQVRGGLAYRQRVRIRYDDGRELQVVKVIGKREVPLDGTEELVVSNKGELADGQRVKTAHPGSGRQVRRGTPPAVTDTAALPTSALKDEVHAQTDVNPAGPQVVAPAVPPVAGRPRLAGRVPPRPPA
ncbi:MAG: efflux RND transporter periplasmic adaptor subunit [Gemmataceae bacterium]|nr:efflux RND transporter periplasmic adaptor subunit [Gemmataceae bacterium]